MSIVLWRMSIEIARIEVLVENVSTRKITDRLAAVLAKHDLSIREAKLNVPEPLRNGEYLKVCTSTLFDISEVVADAQASIPKEVRSAEAVQLGESHSK